MPRSATRHDKRAHAITGDLVEIVHPAHQLTEPFSSHVDISFQGVTHQVLSLQGRAGIDFTHTTGEFTVNGLRGFVIEAIDTVQTHGAHRYQAVVDAPSGLLTVYSYLQPDQLLSLVGALQPIATGLGVVITPSDDVEIVSAARVAMATPHGLIECTPLTAEIHDLLPAWEGSPVPHGELFAGQLGDQAPYLTLVTDTARVLLIGASSETVDAAAEFMSELEVRWTT